MVRNEEEEEEEEEEVRWKSWYKRGSMRERKAISSEMGAKTRLRKSIIGSCESNWLQ